MIDAHHRDPLLGAVLDGRYEVRSRVARGGMATVYCALDLKLDRTVAVKVLHVDRMAGSLFATAGQRVDELAAHVRREAKTVARLAHPNVVAVFDHGIHDGAPYLVMEFVPGRTLRHLLSAPDGLAPAEAVALFEPVLAALAAAHRAGLVHRDVKPENVLIGDDGAVKVADFGLASAVEASAEDTGQILATPAYVSPEQVRRRGADMRSDVYSAGIVLFEMLTGRLPFYADTAAKVAYQRVERDVPPPSRFVPGLPAALDDLVVRATRRDPRERPADAGEFHSGLRAAGAPLGAAGVARPAPAPPPGPTRELAPDPVDGGVTQLQTLAMTRLAQAQRRSALQRRYRLILAAVGCLVVVAGLVLVAVPRPGDEDGPRPSGVDQTRRPRPTASVAASTGRGPASPSARSPAPGPSPTPGKRRGAPPPRDPRTGFPTYGPSPSYPCPSGQWWSSYCSG